MENSEYIERLCTPVREKRLSQSALEVLAIVAYKQPVTKGEIESIRGIKCDRGDRRPPEKKNSSRKSAGRRESDAPSSTVQRPYF